MKVTRKSPVTGLEVERDLSISRKQIEMYEKGVPIAQAFPKLTASEREWYHTGLTDEDFIILAAQRN